MKARVCRSSSSCRARYSGSRVRRCKSSSFCLPQGTSQPHRARARQASCCTACAAGSGAHSKLIPERRLFQELFANIALAERELSMASALCRACTLFPRRQLRKILPRRWIKVRLGRVGSRQLQTTRASAHADALRARRRRFAHELAAPARSWAAAAAARLQARTHLAWLFANGAQNQLVALHLHEPDRVTLCAAELF